MPNYLGGGQDFVVARNNRGGGGMGGLASLGRWAGQVATQKFLISHRADEQIRVQGAGHESKAKWGAVSQAMSNKLTRDDVLGFHDDAFRRFDDEHEDVKSGKVKKDEVTGEYPYLRPELADQVRKAGQSESRKGGQIPGPMAGIARSEIVAEGANHPTPPRTKKSKIVKPTFQPGPITKGEGGNPLLTQPKDGEFQGYTPRKTGAGGYDEALKSGAIDKDTYDSYMEDGQKPGKDYMPKQASHSIDALVKSRTDNLNDGNEDGKK
jgi:hypothetical protein